ncbi:hypothetical protein PGT21_020998 [Puccinia graminis f. sp. tritici]|uniref:Dipeptidyl-peptidase V n=1 Tax=Puccinia graminis f. sp. tritici TaxID=56615 RepID=A0A5B0N121_PUCGR|nr:hypothetical protein PGT21_020998 [Puccinia graminis f. sp. tritici]KAA1124126.1 hypothetical protein PGTUg99_028780 [Puccinia graminis f. sp. tritici]
MVNNHSTNILEPVTLAELPKPGPYIPNPSGQSALSVIKTYNHARQSTVTSLITIDLTQVQDQQASSHTTVLTDLAYAEAVWLDSNSILYLRPPGAQEAGPDLDPLISTKLAREHLKKRLEELADDQGKGIELWAIRIGGKEDKKTYRVGSLPVPIGNLKFQSFSSSSAGVLGFSVDVYPPYDTEALKSLHKLERSFEEAAEGSTGQTYDSVYVRHWDEWIDQHGKEARLFVIDLEQKEDHTWFIPDSHQPRSLFPSLSVPVGPSGSSSDFDMSSSSAVVTAKDPDVNPAWHTRQNIYIMPLYPRTKLLPKPLQLTTGDQGGTSNPVFSPSAKNANGCDQGKVAWLEMNCDGYESDQNQVVVYNLESRTRSYFAKSWDRSPSKIIWGKDDNELYLLAEEHGRVKVFYLSLESSEGPECLTEKNSASYLAYLGTKSAQDAEKPAARLLLTMSSLAFGPTPYILDLALPDHCTKCTNDGSFCDVSGTTLDEGEDFWFHGAENRSVHGILIRPPGFVADQGQKWPLMFLIHGGPQGAWDKTWSLRWNANTFAGAGYIVAMINPTGSTGYGQKFTDSIKQDWGGKPYKDLVAGYQYLLKTYAEIDGSRTAALGASYGGYMVNWMMGHNESPLDFKAFVSHDGIFNTLQTAYSTDELYFPEHDHGGTPVQKREEYEKFNPLNFVGKWNTPCLVIHSRKDYRLCESEGLSVFNALQRRGIPSRFLYFPDESHWVSNPPNSIRWYHEIFRFLGKWCPPGQITI